MFLSILFNVLLAVHVLTCLLLVLIVMMQRPKQEGLGAAFASGMMTEFAGAQTTDVLQKGTRFLAIVFFILSICLAVIKAHQNKDIVSPISPEPAAESETAPAAPTAPEGAPADVTPEPAAPEGAPAEAAPEPAEPETAEPGDAAATDQPSEAPAENEDAGEPAPDKPEN